MTTVYTDDRKFLYLTIDDTNIKLAVRLVGSALEFKVKDRAIINKLQRDIVLVPLSDIMELSQEVDKSDQI